MAKGQIFSGACAQLTNALSNMLSIESFGNKKFKNEEDVRIRRIEIEIIESKDTLKKN